MDYTLSNFAETNVKPKVVFQKRQKGNPHRTRIKGMWNICYYLKKLTIRELVHVCKCLLYLYRYLKFYIIIIIIIIDLLSSTMHFEYIS